jgi:MSHA biogenesis protein MshN
MGLSYMSLINKMLQDLEGRRLEGEIVGSVNGQIRAAPEPKRIHVAWWIVLGLTLILTGLISWLSGYRAAPSMATGDQAPQLALKLAPNIQMPQVPAAAINAQIEEKGSVSAGTAPPAPDSANVDNAASLAADESSKSKPAVATATPSAMQASAEPAGPTSAPVGSQAAAAAASTVTLPAPETATPAQVPPVRAAVGKSTVRAVPAPASAAKREIRQPENEAEFDIPRHVAKQIKELTPQQRADEEYRRATVLLEQGRHSESIAALEKALQLDAQHSLARQTLAGQLLEAKRPGDAIRTLQEGLAVDRNHPALAMMLARLQVDKGDLRPAVETLQRTLPYAADRADYQAFLAALLQREGRHKEASEHYFLALRKSPQNGIWWMGIGISLQADNRVTEARDAFARARESNNLSPELAAFVEQKLNQLR